MKPLIQRKIVFENTCNCIVDSKDLEKAVVWYSDSYTKSKKKIFMHGRYPAVSIYQTKIHVHRLLMCYWLNRIIGRKEYVHHKDENRLNSSKDNLQVLSASIHQSITNKGKKQSKEFVEKRINAMRIKRAERKAIHTQTTTP